LTTGEALAAGTAYLDRRGIETPRLETELILAHALGLSRLELYTGHDRPLTEAERLAARQLLERRASREPLAYVLGEWGFRTLQLRTDARALVPRPETEFLVERALVALAGERAPRIVDVGTGSGAIALSLAAEYPGALVSATDVSPEALSLAAENAAALGLHVEFVETNLLDGLEGPFDLVVSNPPYVTAAELPSLEPEVRDWEPRLALLDLEQTEELAAGARSRLRAGAALLLECHSERAQAVAALLERLGYSQVAVARDLAGRDRVVEARWPGTS
jgi:release factor glutamine methyltransferase